MFSYKRFIILIALGLIIYPACILSQEHKIRPGDVIDIVVYGHQEMSRVVKVNPNGTLDFPLLQNIPVDGLNLSELREVIVVQLSKYIDRPPFVTVSLVDTYTINVIVLGQVIRPGSYQIPANSTVQGAIGQAGGLLPGANISAIKVNREKGGGNNGENQAVDLMQFLISGNSELLPPLENGDMIVVPSYSSSITIKVMGEVNRPGSYDVITGHNNLLDIIFLAGGPTEKANLKKIQLTSPFNKQKQTVQLNLKNHFDSKIYQEIPEVKPGDIIFIPKKRNTWSQFMTLVRDLTPFVTLYYMIQIARRY